MKLSLLLIVFTLCNFALLLAEEPRHLIDLRVLQENVLPANTDYRHKDREVKWKGFDDAKDYISKTDCSGLVNSLLIHSYQLPKLKMRSILGRVNAKASDYYRTILNQKGFKHIKHIRDVEAGDFIAIKFLPWAEDKARDTGHIMVVNNRPKQEKVRSVDGQVLLEWAVEVIDSSHGHGTTDTRYREGRYWPGLGKGVAALYTDKEGDILGYSWSTADKSLYYDKENRPLVVGRLN